MSFEPVTINPSPDMRRRLKEVWKHSQACDSIEDAVLLCALYGLDFFEERNRQRGEKAGKITELGPKRAANWKSQGFPPLFEEEPKP